MSDLRPSDRRAASKLISLLLRIIGGAYRFTTSCKFYGFPSFGFRKDLVKWCVGSDDDSIVTVYLKVLKDETGYCFYPFSPARLDLHRIPRDRS